MKLYFTGMDAPDFETPLGEQLKELEKSPMLDDAEFADFDEEMPIEDDIELGESDDQSDQLFEAAIRKDLRAEKSALSEIGHDEEKVAPPSFCAANRPSRVRGM